MFAGKTDVGLKRPNNEDSFVVREDLGLCVAADGMGGAAAGELASRLFTDTALEVFSDNSAQSEDEITYCVKKTFSVANQRIQEHIKENPDHKGMGCTAELLAFIGSRFILGHVGDSRTYILRNRALRQLTLDHTFVQEQVSEGLIPVEEIKNHPMRNVILRAVGIDKELTLDIFKGTIIPKDLFLLCSDGLTDMIPDHEIMEILDTDYDLNRKIEALIEQAKDAGGKDNITVVLAEID
jgi:protein phosphatase